MSVNGLCRAVERVKFCRCTDERGGPHTSRIGKHMNGGFGEDGVEESVSVVRGAAE